MMQSGFIKIDADSGDNIQGTFEFEAGNDSGDIINVTNGSFNLDY